MNYPELSFCVAGLQLVETKEPHEPHFQMVEQHKPKVPAAVWLESLSKPILNVDVLLALVLELVNINILANRLMTSNGACDDVHYGDESLSDGNVSDENVSDEHVSDEHVSESESLIEIFGDGAVDVAMAMAMMMMSSTLMMMMGCSDGDESLIGGHDCGCDVYSWFHQIQRVMLVLG